MTFPSKYAGKCKSCGKVINIGMDIDKNDSGIYCPDGKNCQGSQTVSGTLTTAVSHKITSAQALEECIAFHNTFKDITNDASYESTAKIYISRMMSR